MKKILWIVLLSALIFTACKKDDFDGIEPNNRINYEMWDGDHDLYEVNNLYFSHIEDYSNSSKIRLTALTSGGGMSRSGSIYCDLWVPKGSTTPVSGTYTLNYSGEPYSFSDFDINALYNVNGERGNEEWTDGKIKIEFAEDGSYKVLFNISNSEYGIKLTGGYRSIW